MAGHPSRWLERHPKQCTGDAQTAAVRCCDDTGGGFSPGCQTLNHDGASAHCAASGYRLCAKSELDQTKGSGCGFDGKRTWTSSQCCALPFEPHSGPHHGRVHLDPTTWTPPVLEAAQRRCQHFVTFAKKYMNFLYYTPRTHSGHDLDPPPTHTWTLPELKAALGRCGAFLHFLKVYRGGPPRLAT